MSNNNFNFENLKKLIEESGLTYDAVSNGTGINKSIIRNYIDGLTVPKIDAVVTLADFFAVPIDFLVGRCTKEEEEAILKDYPTNFMKLRRASFENYLCLVKKDAIDKIEGYESAWPYNLIEEVVGSEYINNISTKDQLKGLDAALDTLTEREKQVLLMRYRDGLTFNKIGKQFCVGGNRIRQIHNKAIRKLRAPHRCNLVLYGTEIVELNSFVENKRKLLMEQVANLTSMEEDLQRRKERTLAVIKDDLGVAKMIGINELGLSCRTYNCMIRSNHNNLGDMVELAKLGIDECLKIRNFGHKSYEEMIKVIKQYTGLVIDESGKILNVEVGGQ